MPTAKDDKKKTLKDKIVKPELNVLNTLRRIILRIRPYMSTSTNLQVCCKSLQIYQNLISYLNDRELSVENEAKGMFSAEDANNTKIPCALAATTYEIFDSFIQILKSNKKP